MELDEADSDADNLTSLHEMLLDEHEAASDDDKQFASNNCNNTDAELMPTYENVNKDMYNKQQNQQATEKGINDLCKVNVIAVSLFTS